MLKKIGKHLLGFVAFIVLSSLSTDQATQLYDIYKHQKGEKTTVVVQEKVVFRDLFNKNTYFAVLKAGAEEKLTFDSNEDALTEVPKDVFQHVNKGDEIKGNKTVSIFSDEDAKSLIYEHLIFLGIFLVYPLFYVFYQLLRIPAFNEWATKHDRWVLRIFATILIAIASVLFAIGYVSLGKSLVHTFSAHSGNQQATEATIVDRYEDVGRRKYETDYYYLALSFTDENGTPVYLTKEVTPNIYHNHQDHVTVHYPKGSPYSIHIEDNFSISNLFFYIRKLEIYGIMVLITLLLLIFGGIRLKKRFTASA
ncbi:hypothetical protein [Priestia koreensis]|uniref:hypothetical protein n=1 Tax=Priestia koreensis TaxID=284581 RepID=UPI0028F704FC|nr:hypothetical protein [Priestia koreensis]